MTDDELREALRLNQYNWREETFALLGQPANEWLEGYLLASGGGTAALELCRNALLSRSPEAMAHSENWRIPEVLDASIDMLSDDTAFRTLAAQLGSILALYRWSVRRDPKLKAKLARLTIELDNEGLAELYLDELERATGHLLKDGDFTFWFEAAVPIIKVLTMLPRRSESEKLAVIAAVDPSRTGPDGPLGWVAHQLRECILTVDVLVDEMIGAAENIEGQRD